MYEIHRDFTEWLELTNSYFKIYYRNECIQDANNILNFVRYARDNVLENLPFDFNKIINVYIHNQPTFILGRRLEWHIMRSEINNRNIHLISPTNAFQHSNFYDNIWYKANIIHEYVHHVVANQIRIRSEREMHEFLPKWFSEGIAGYIPYFLSSPEIMRKYHQRLEEKGDIVRNGNGDFDTIADDEYFGGAILVKYMFDEYGRCKVLNLISSRASNWEEAIEEELDTSYRRFQDKWLLWANEYFRT